MHKYMHSPKAITLRNDAHHCNRRRTHQTHTNYNNSSRATHLPAGCDIQRKRLSSTFRSKRCSCKSLVDRYQSDTSLSCKTISSKDIISLDSTDDEADKDESEKLSTEKSSMIIENRNQSQSTQQRIVRRVRPTLQPVDNRQTNTATQRTKPCNAHGSLRLRKIPSKKVDLIVLNSSSEDEETSATPVDADEVVSKHKIDKMDDTPTEDPATPTAQPQQMQQQAARARLQSVSMPLRCTLIGSVAIKPIRKEKHCIPGEVSSTTSHDIGTIETKTLNEAPAVSCSANLVVNNASAYENAREVGTVEILERRELHQPVVMAERCFQPGKLLLGIDYSDDENEDDVAERSREDITAGSDAGDNDDISNGCIIPMVGGYSKVVEEATSSTEVFQRIQSLENVAATEALRIVEPAPLVLAGPIERTANVAIVSEDAPTCSRYANSNASSASESKNDTQKEGTKATTQAVKFKNDKNRKISVKDFASANIIGKGNDTPEDRLEENVCRPLESVPPTFGLLADMGNADKEEQIGDENDGLPSIKTVALLPERPITANNEIQDFHNELTDSVVKKNATHVLVEDDETAAIDQILADIDENLRESHEFNEKYMKTKNAGDVKTHNVEVKLTKVCENVQNELDLRNTAAQNLENNAIGSDCEVFEEVSPAKSALTHTSNDLLMDVCEPALELEPKSSNIDVSKWEANITVMETKSVEVTDGISSNRKLDEVLCEKSNEAVEKVTAVEEQTLQITQNDINSEGTEEVITTVSAESESMNNSASEEIIPDLDARSSNTNSIKNNEEIELTQEYDILNDIRSNEVNTSVSPQDNPQVYLNGGSTEPQKCKLPDEETTVAVSPEKDRLAIMDTKNKAIAVTNSGEKSSNSNLKESVASAVNVKDKVEDIVRSTEVIGEHTKDKEVLVKSDEYVVNGTNLSLQEKEISKLSNVNQEEGDATSAINANITLTTSINNDVFEFGSTDCDSQDATDLISSMNQAHLNILTTDLNTEMEVSPVTTKNIDDEVHNLTKAASDELIAIKNTSKHKVELPLQTNKDKEFELGTETEFESRTVVDEAKNAEKDDTNKTREECLNVAEVSAASRHTENDNVDRYIESGDAVNCVESETDNKLAKTITPKGLLEDSYKPNELTFVEDIENLPTGVRESDNESFTPIEFVKEKEMALEEKEMALEEKEMVLESPEVSEPIVSGIAELTVITMQTVKDVIESENETDARRLHENATIPITEEMLSADNERETVEPETTDIELPQQRLKSKDIECHEISESVSRLDEKERRNKIKLTKQNRELVKKSDSSIEKASEMTEVESSRLATKENDNIEELTVGNIELVNDTKQHNDEIRETPLLESYTITHVNESEAGGTVTTDIETVPLDVKSKDIECHEISYPVSKSKEEVSESKILLTNENFDSSVIEETETADVEALPLTTNDHTNNSHVVSVLATRKMEEVTLDSIELMKYATNEETEQKTVLESAKKFEVGESEVDELKDIDNKSPLDLKDTECHEISDSAPDNNDEQTVLTTETQIADQNLQERADFSIEEGSETADVEALSISDEKTVSASNEMEEEELVQTEDKIKTTCIANEELVNKSAIAIEETPENTGLEITSETTTDTDVVADVSPEETENSRYDNSLEDKQFTETLDSQTQIYTKALVERADVFENEEALNKNLDTFLENSNEFHESQRCEIPVVNEILSCEGKIADETEITMEKMDSLNTSEVQDKSSTSDENKESSAIDTKVIGNLVDEEIMKSDAVDNVEANSCSQDIAKKERKQSIEEQERLDEINSEKAFVNSTKNLKTSKSHEALLNSISDVTPNHCTLSNVLPNESFDQDSDRNGNISEENLKEIAKVTELDVKEITEETHSKNYVSESCEILSGDEQVQESSVEDLQVDEQIDDINTIMEQGAVSLADSTESMDLVIDEDAITNSFVQTEVDELAEKEKSVDLVIEENAITNSSVPSKLVESAENEDNPLKKCSSEEPLLIVAKKSVTSGIPDEKARNVEEVQLEIKLTAKSSHRNDVNNSNAKEFKSDGVEEMLKISEPEPLYSETATETESEQKDAAKSTVPTEAIGVNASVEGVAAVKNSLSNNDQSSVTIATLLECATAKKRDLEAVKTCSRPKLKLKAKPHKLIKTIAVKKRTINSGKRFSKLKVVRNSKKRLLTEDASNKIRIKSRVSLGNDPNKDLDSIDELKTAEELADNIAKLVIKENLEVATNFAMPENETKEATEQDDSKAKDIDGRSLENNTEILQNQTTNDIIDETEQKILTAEPELREDCTTFQRLPSEYNSEEILAVTTLINMRNKYASSTYIDEDNVVVGMPLEINRDGEAENVEASLKKANTKEGLVKKKVRFDEDNLLQLMNEKYKVLKKVKKSGKKIEKSCKAEGALLSGAGGGKKYVKRRLLELTMNLSTSEPDYITDHTEQVPDLKKKRGRKGRANAQEEQPLTQKMDKLNEEFKGECAGSDNPIYPVRLTSRRKTETTAVAKLSKSIKNKMRKMKCDTPSINDVEEAGSDFIVPDDEVEPLCTKTYEKPSVPKEAILNVSRVCVDGTKIKFKIIPKEAVDEEKPLKVEKLEEQDAFINKTEKKASKEKISATAELMKTRKVTVKLKRVQMPLYATAILKRSIFCGFQSATLTDSEEPDPILPESPNKYKKGEELGTIVQKSPTKCKKLELASDISSNESNVTKSDVLDSPKSTNNSDVFIAADDMSSKSSGKASHRKHRTKSPYKKKKSVKRNVPLELSELSPNHHTAIANAQLNAEETYIKNVSIGELPSIEDLRIEPTSLGNRGVVENLDPTENRDSTAKITLKSAHKKRLAKSSSKIKSPPLSTTCKDTIKEAPNKEPTTILNVAIEKITYNNEKSDIRDVANVQTAPTFELSPRKDAPRDETFSNKEPIVPPEQLKKMGVVKTQDSNINTALKAGRKKRMAKSKIKIKLPLSSLTTKKLSCIVSTLNKEGPAVKESIAETSSILKAEGVAKTDTSIEKTPFIQESTNTREPAMKEASPNKELITALKRPPLERVEIVSNHEHVGNKVSNLSVEVGQFTAVGEETTTIQERTLSDVEIKTEPLEDIDIKEEEDSCEDPIDIAQSYLNIDNRRHAKEFILKPCDVILTEAKINEQADAHRGYRKQRSKKLVRVVEKAVPTTPRGNRYRTGKNKETIGISKSAENIIETENAISTLEECAQIEESIEVINERKKPKVQKELQAETTVVVLEKDKDVNNAETAAGKEIGKEIEHNATPSTADVETEDNTSSITDNVIAELKLLSPESLQNTEDDKEPTNLISSSENAAVGTVVDIEQEPETQLTIDTVSVCKVEKTDEEQKTAQLLDSSIDIVLGNATFTKIPLTPKKDVVSSASDAGVSKSPQNIVDAVAEAKKPDDISESTPTKNRLDVLTAEKINSVLEKMLEEKNNLVKDCKSKSTTDSNVRKNMKRQTITEEEGLRKSSNRSSLNRVKQISAKVPDALFADDESESSNADDSTSDERFFAPILSLDDLLIKKDEPTTDITHTYTPMQEQVVEETDAGHSRDGLGTPNFTVELEVETTQASDENTQNANANRKVELQSEETGKCVTGEELNTHLEETDANFSLSAIADISTIDIPNDLNINNEYPDLLDTMLFEQVRQSIDCMISGTNSAKKWSQDSFATTKAAVNFNKTETAIRKDVAPNVSIPQVNDVIATIDKTVIPTEDAIGIGQESFLGTISSLDEVEVPTTDFDLVGSFTIADFLSDAGSDLFAFPELDKTQCRSSSFSPESNLCETPPPPAIDTADEETSNDKKDESAIQPPTNHKTNSVACDHSYNKDINEVEKQRTRVRKKSTSSHTSPLTQKSATASPLNNSDMLHTFSRSKCLPKPFWKVKKTEEIKTSTPRKEEPTTNSQNTQQQTAAAAVKRTIALSPTTVKNVEEQKQTVFSMPALELVIEQTVSSKEITAAPSGNLIPDAIANPTTTETLTNLNENISKTDDDVILASKPATTESVKAEVLEKVTPQKIASVTKPPKRASTPIEITEVITIPAPIIVQPIIRIQSQTNRLERIDPSSSTSQQAFPIPIPESQPNLIDAPNLNQIEINNISRPERDSTPTLDEPTKDEYELTSPNKLIIVQELTHTAKSRQSPAKFEEPPAKRLCVENVNKTITTNDIFDMLKSEERLQKEKQLERSYTNTTKMTSSASCKIVDAQPNQAEIELKESKAFDNINSHTSSALISSQVENNSPRPCTKSANFYNEKRDSESPAINQQHDKKPLEIQPTKQKDEKISANQEPILISKETLIALNKRENSTKNISVITTTEQLQPLSPESSPEKCSNKFTDSKLPTEKLKISPSQCLEHCKVKKSIPMTLETSKDSLSQPNQSNDCHQLGNKQVQFKNTPSTTMPNTKLDIYENSVMSVTPRSDEHSSSARTSSLVQSKEQKGSITSPVLSNESPCAKSNINVNLNKTNENTKSSSQRWITEKEDMRYTPPIKTNISIKIKDLPIAETISKSEIKNSSPCQTVTISPLTRVPPKPILAVAPTLLTQSANHSHPYQKTQIPPNTLNTHKSKVTPQRQSQESLSAAPENFSNKKKETIKSAVKSAQQRIATTVTTLPPLMQSRPTPSQQPSFGTPLTITDLASIKLTAEEEADIARKLAAYRTTLPQAKTYGAHKENQRLANLHEEKLRLEYAERAHRRKVQQLRDTQRLKRKSQSESFEAHYKKFAKYSGKPNALNNSNCNNRSGAGVGAGNHQSRFKQYSQYPQHHSSRPRSHHEYVNKFGEIEKLVEKEKVTKDIEAKRSVPLTTSTAWEPKMPTGDELIELLSKTKKS